MKRHIVFDCDGTLIDTSNFKYQLFPGIKDLLLELKKDSCLYVWTARDRASTMRILQEQGVYSLFDAFCTVDDALPKPHISGLMELVGTHPKSQICVIGDTSNDILGAKNFAVLSIGAGWNKQIRTEILKELGASFIATHPAQCADWIRQHIF